MKHLSHVIFYICLLNLSPNAAMSKENYIKMKYDSNKPSRDFEGLPIYPLFLAATSGSLPTVQRLLDSKAHVDALSSRYETSALIQAAARGHLDMVKALINANAEVDKREKITNKTALYYAALRRHPEIVACLLAANANPNIANQHGCTPPIIAVFFTSSPLMAAAETLEYERSVGDIVSQLLASKADIHQVDLENGYTALHYAAQKNHKPACQLLIAARACVNAKNKNGETPIDLAKRHDIREQHALDEQLYQATLEGDTVTVRKLLHARANPNYAGLVGFTPLQLAALFKGKRTSPSLVEQLLQCKADVNAKNNCGSTALHFAAEHSVEISKLLVHAGALVNAQNKQGKKPVECTRHADVKEFLTSVGEQKEGE